jgi:hypothetical protein
MATRKKKEVEPLQKRTLNVVPFDAVAYRLDEPDMQYVFWVGRNEEEARANVMAGVARLFKGKYDYEVKFDD